MSLLAMEGITKSYGTRTLFTGIDLRVHRRERVALIGANGIGKTTLLRIASGREIPDGGVVTLARGTRLGYLPQEPECGAAEDAPVEAAKSFGAATVLERRLRELEAAMAADPASLARVKSEYDLVLREYENMGGYACDAAVRATLLGLGLRPDVLQSPMETLSGGERMRVALAGLLLGRPDLLILDEPTNHLDMQAAEWLERYLAAFPGGVLLVSHDRYFLDQTATRVAALESRGIWTCSGNYSTYLNELNRRPAYAAQEHRRLTDEIARQEELVRRFKGEGKISAAWSRAKAAERLRVELAAVQQDRPARQPSPAIRLAAPEHLSAVVIEVAGLRKRYGPVTLFDGAGFTIRGGERVGLIGPNGCGKTTLLRILLGKDGEYEGIARIGPWVRYAYLGQEQSFADEGRSVIEEILADRDMRPGEARQYLARFLFRRDDVYKTIAVLSGGEKARLTLARILLDQPHCLILDEPTNHLDLEAREAMAEALNLYTGTILAVSHDRSFLDRCVTRLLVVTDRQIASFAGGYEAYKNSLSVSTGTDRRPERETRRAAAPSARLNPQKLASNLQSIEERIAILEVRAKELADSFGAGTPLETYCEHARISAELASLYADWTRTAEHYEE